ncbi:MAG: NAD-glutamate dehydrogenase, partial [Alphaproteobacteria bacterium]|nr:NAD-glutamate dehydrogenase [Alphaproteobacteria bacterium]
MPDTQPATDPVREEALRQALAAMPPGLPPSAAALLPPLLEGLPLAQLAAMPADQAAAMAVSLHSLAARRLPGQARIRVQPAGRFPHPVVEIITDDMPFLVDSVLATITRAGRHPRQVLHPILAVARDAQGALVAVGPGELRESIMRVALSGAESDAPALEALLAATLFDVRRAVEDFPAMLAELQRAQSLAKGEARDFLAWLTADNFVLLGHRRIMADGAALRAEAGLGLLRGEAPIFDALRDLSDVPPAVRAGLLAPEPLSVAKANMRSTVHRPQHADVIAVRIFDAAGAVTGVRLFLGLFAAPAYNRNPRSIPLLATKVERILDAAGVSAFTHDGRALRNILDTWPRDELFQATEAEVLDGARRALDITLTPRPALVLRRDPFGRFVSAIVWLPRENFDTRLRTKVGEMLARAHHGRLSTFYIALGDGPLARVHYIIATDPAVMRHPDASALESLVAEAARAFPDRLRDALVATRGEEATARLMARWADAFPPAYRELETAQQAAADLALAEAALAGNRPATVLESPPGAGPRRLALRLANPGGPLPLADALPLFESLDLRAIEEEPHRLILADGTVLVLHVFQLETAVDVPPNRYGELLGALDALLARDAEADGFNRLVARAGLS